MNRHSLSLLLFAMCAGVLFAACSGESTGVVDPHSNDRTQVALFAVVKGAAGELARYNETTGAFTLDEFETINGAPLGMNIDAIYREGEHLYLHHRDAGVITVLELATRRRIATIPGFPSKGDGQMCAMAFSNSSQAWVVCAGSKNLFQVDLFYNNVSDTIALPEMPTHVGAVDTLVFACMQRPDGSGLVGVLKSNTGGVFDFVAQIGVTSPVIYSAPTVDHREYVLVTAGGPGVKPTVYYISTSSLAEEYHIEIDTDPLVDYIGKEPTFAAYTKSDFLYLALKNSVVQMPYGTDPYEWLSGSYSIIAADPSTDLLYAYSPGSLAVKRLTANGEQLEDLTAPADVHAIYFVGANSVR